MRATQACGNSHRMWVATFVLLQGTAGVVLVVIAALWDFPKNIGDLLALPFPATMVGIGIWMRRRERNTKPHRITYLDGNEHSRRRKRLANILKWGAPFAVLIVCAAAAVLWPESLTEGTTPNLFLTTTSLVLIIGSIFVGSMIEQDIDDAAARAADGKPPATKAETQKKHVFMAAAIAFVGCLMLIDYWLKPPISAPLIFLVISITFAAAMFVWRKFRAR